MRILVIEPGDVRRANIVDTVREVPGVEVRAATASSLVGCSVLSREVIDAIVVGALPLRDLASLKVAAEGQRCPVIIASDRGALASALHKMVDGARDELPERTEVLDLASWLPMMVARLRSVVPEYIEVVPLVSEGTQPVVCVPTALQHVLLDLILKACGALPWGGTVWVAVQPVDAQQVKLEVIESGKGRVLDLTLRAA